MAAPHKRITTVVRIIERIMGILLLLMAAIVAALRADATTIENQLANARRSTIENLNLMHQRWEFNSPRLQFLLVAANMPSHAWDILKFKIATKYLKSLLKQGTDDTSFLMIFGGSSVTASHDNYLNQSLSSVCDRRMRGSFDALGLPFKVHNIAHGNNPCRPSNLCYNAMGGDRADWLQWEQSFNCGRDPGVFELMARVAYWNKAVMFYSASGGFTPSHCPPSNDTIPWISEQWSPENEPLFRNQSPGGYHPYAPNHTAVLALRERLNAFFEESSSVGRFAPVGYPGVAPYGFSVWSKSPALCQNDIKGGVGCSAMEIMGDCQGRVGGVHWMTREGGVYGRGAGAGTAEKLSALSPTLSRLCSSCPHPHNHIHHYSVVIPLPPLTSHPTPTTTPTSTSTHSTPPHRRHAPAAR